MPLTFEPSGELKPPTAEELAEADAHSAIIAYTYGTSEDGAPYYAYVAVTPSKYQEFYAMTVARQPMVIADYGTIIMSGAEAEPPPEVVKEMRERYGFDEHYAQKLEEDAIKEQQAFLEAQEAKRIEGIVDMLKKQNPEGEDDSQ